MDRFVMIQSLSSQTPEELFARVDRLLERFGLTGPQKEAARERLRDVAVTAGAGSGKTRTLVARYLPLLAECGSPRRVVAITFTDKAAREMRSRIRTEVRRLVVEAGEDGERRFWGEIESRLDAARISTIHSLCQEILRSHPVEAGLDPDFSVAEEGQAAVWQAQAVRDVLTGAVEDDSFQPLFALWKVATLELVLGELLGRRLDLEEKLDSRTAIRQAGEALVRWLYHTDAAAAVKDLRAWKADGTLYTAAQAGDKAADLVFGLVDDLDRVESCLIRGDVIGAAQALLAARAQHMAGNVGKKGQIKETLKELREAFDERLGCLGDNKNPLPTTEQEAQCETANQLLLELFQRCRDRYLGSLRQQNTLDFDDLEGMAAALLCRPEIAARWQAEIASLLVDEFQDTNARQRTIVRALCGSQPGKLFVVGDARQSIYRFRGADVTVFRGLQEEVRREDGLSIDLDRTFRAHTGLLEAMGGLLAPVMGEAADTARPYHVPYAALTSDHADPRTACQAPHVEFVLAGGEDADDGRPRAALALAQRLLELKASGQIAAWDRVTLLFRASTGFPAYEDAFEACGIPYMTTAGRGFYDRPEVRDVLNILRALADPWDDLALTGLLKSPVFGLSDVGLAQLRWRGDERVPLYQALSGELSPLSEADRETVERAKRFLGELSPLVDRIPVAELLSRVTGWTDYRAVLAGGSSRLWRNLDKLRTDAQASRTVQVAAFLEYLKTLKDAGAREGEAPVEAEGAVRLMSVHKSKGLEFDIVVLADAARTPPRQGGSFTLLPETGLALKPDRLETAPLAYRYARWLDGDQAEAADRRLLYVALTRAKEKVLISGHVSLGRNPVQGWLKALLEAAGVDPLEAVGKAGEYQTITLNTGQSVGVWAAPPDLEPLESIPDGTGEEPPAQPEAGLPLFAPLPFVIAPPDEDEEIDEPIWQATGPDEQRFGISVGKMVHKAIQRWAFLGDARLPALLDTAAMENGLVEARQREKSVAEAETLLGRFCAHPLWETLDRAECRLHEVPYTLSRRDGQVEVGYLDVLYRVEGGWWILDFKTDTIAAHVDLNRLVEKYGRQLRRYSRAVRELLGPVQGSGLCFLDDRGRVTVVEV